SSDDVSWTEASGVAGTGVSVAEGPSGLVAVGLSSSGSAETQTVWTSADGRTWSKAGTTSGLGHMVSLAGNSNTLVAVWNHSGSGNVNGVLDGSNLSTETSADGLHWSKVAQVAFGTPNIWAPPFVTAAGGRLFAMGPAANSGTSVRQNPNVFMSTAVTRGTIWWSDDGKTWHLAGGNFRGLPWAIDVAAQGLLLEGTLDSAPGGDTFAYSTDGGQTWTDDPRFAPLGPVACTGECASGPDGFYSSNGTVIVAVKGDGSKAWISSDARTWTQIAWGGPTGGIMALPGGVVAGDQYGAGK
ncbi:MAG: sialidase family protein, partial [Candidatus Limnocylindrales bacterium]